MALGKNLQVGNRATEIGYWRYEDLIRYDITRVPRFDAKEGEAAVVDVPCAVISLGGYSTEEARRAAQKNGRDVDFRHEYAFMNWQELIQETKPMTLAEKRTALEGSPMLEGITQTMKSVFAKEHKKEPTEDELKALVTEAIKALKMDKIVKEEIIYHNDYDDFKAAYNTPNERAVVYRLLKNRPFFDAQVFTDATEV